MPVIRAQQHLFSNVERGYTHGRGRGFQTVAVSKELAGSEDLKVLERAAFYNVPRDRRAAGDLPVKDVFFYLPSGKVAVGRTVDWGQDAMGREGNYLTHHLILTKEELLAAGGNPFVLIAQAELASPRTDLSPRDLPVLELEIDSPAGDPGFSGSTAATRSVAAALVQTLLEPEPNGKAGPRPILLIGAGDAPAALVRGVVTALQPEYRVDTTLCTHFFESGSLRQYFRVMAVGSRAEQPSQASEYVIFDLGRGDVPALPRAKNPYTGWLAAQLETGASAEIQGYNEVRAQLRTRGNGAGLAGLGPTTRETLWKVEEDLVHRALVGRPALISAFLRDLPTPRPIANKLLEHPLEELLGSTETEEAQRKALADLRGGASGMRWRGWVRRHQEHPLVRPYEGDLIPWMVRAAKGVLDLMPRRR